MKKKWTLVAVAFVMLSAVFCAYGDKEMRIVTDMGGRKVTVPAVIKKVFAINPIGTIFIYTLTPDKLVGWNYKLTPEAKKWILPSCRELPVIGHLYGRSSNANAEILLKAEPDILIIMGSPDKASNSVAEKLQRQMNLPVILIDDSLSRMDAAYEFAGELLNETEKAKELASYCRDTLKKAKKRMTDIPMEKRPGIYYAEGPSGLLTDGKESKTMEILELAGGRNVAELPARQRRGRSKISFEQILQWNPDFIMVGYTTGHSTGLYQVIMSDKKWNLLPAVTNKKIIEIPRDPFSWFDRPPSVNRILGIPWLTNVLYGKKFDIDIVSEVKVFYEKFYHCSLTDEDVKQLLKPT